MKDALTRGDAAKRDHDRAGEAVTIVERRTGSVCAFGSNDQPDDRLPQWTQRRKIVPGSHHIPKSWRPER
jgi:hypothetical protein